MNAESTQDVKDSPWSPASASEPRLLADIGATYARFCVEDSPGHFNHVVVFPCASYTKVDAVRPAAVVPGSAPGCAFDTLVEVSRSALS